MEMAFLGIIIVWPFDIGFMSNTAMEKEFSAIILEGISLAVMEHEFVSIIGTSGCGKSTLLELIGATSMDEINIMEVWNQSRPFDTLAVPVGTGEKREAGWPLLGLLNGIKKK